MLPGNSSQFVSPTDVRPNEPVYPVDICKSVYPADVCKPVCLLDKPFFVDYLRHVILFLILLLFAVSVNSVFNRTILYMNIIFISIQMTYLIYHIQNIHILF